MPEGSFGANWLRTRNAETIDQILRGLSTSVESGERVDLGSLSMHGHRYAVSCSPRSCSAYRPTASGALVAVSFYVGPDVALPTDDGILRLRNLVSVAGL
jgi:hypothetical protein